jgi:ABC-type nitrate/sulfonate/bicarbonate transport system substrate-binding protein
MAQKGENTRLRVVYRAASQFPLLFTIREAGIWAKYGIDAELTLIPGSKEAEEALLGGKADILFGNHTTPYSRRVRKGERFVYLAQTVNFSNRVLVASPGITSVDMIKGRKVLSFPIGIHPELTDKLHLLEMGIDPDRGDVIRVPSSQRAPQERLESVLQGEADAALVTPPDDLKAKRMGLNVIDTPKVETVWSVTLLALSPFIEEYGALITAILKVLADGIHYFKTKREETLRILEEHVAGPLQLEDRGLVERLYDSTAEILEKKLYPTPKAISTVFQMALREDPGLEGFNPLAMWDLHYLRKLDESGFIDGLYRD